MSKKTTVLYNKLLSEIDSELKHAGKESNLFVTFKIADSTFKIGKRLESLNRFRAQVVLKRRFFADHCFAKKAVLSDSLPEVIPTYQTEKKTPKTRHIDIALLLSSIPTLGGYRVSL